MLLVLAKASICIDEYVIEVGRTEFVQVFPEGPIDIALEGAWGISHTKGSD